MFIEDWQVAFEAAGFKNAILAKDPPSKEEDPDWSPEDVRYSVIRYISTEIKDTKYDHTDIKAMARATLTHLTKDIKRGIKGQKDKVSLYHFKDLSARIDDILNKKTK